MFHWQQAKTIGRYLLRRRNAPCSSRPPPQTAPNSAGSAPAWPHRPQPTTTVGPAAAAADHPLKPKCDELPPPPTTPTPKTPTPKGAAGA